MTRRTLRSVSHWTCVAVAVALAACSSEPAGSTSSPSPERSPQAVASPDATNPAGAATAGQPAEAATASQPAGRVLASTESYKLTAEDLVTYVTHVNRVYNFDVLTAGAKEAVVREIFVNHELALEAMKASLQNWPTVRNAVEEKIQDQLSKYLVDAYNAKLDEMAQVSDEELSKYLDDNFGESVELWTIAMEDAGELEKLRAELAAAPASDRKELFIQRARERSEGLSADRGGALGFVSTHDTKIPVEYVRELLKLPALAVSGLKPIRKTQYVFLVGEKRLRDTVWREDGPRMREQLFTQKRQALLSAKLAELDKKHKVKVYADRLEKDYKGPDKEVVAEVSGREIRWKPSAGTHGPQRVFTPLQELNRTIMRILLTEEARSLGLDKTREFGRVQTLTVDREWRSAYLQSRGGYVPSEAEIRKYFEESTRSDLLEIAMVKASSLAEAKKVRALVGEKPFEELVATYSKDARSKKAGGLWGRFQMRELPSALEVPLFKLKAGEVSQPLAYEGGYALFKVLSRSPSPYKELTPEVREVIAARLALQRKGDDVTRAASEAARTVEGLTIDKAALAALKISE